MWERISEILKVPGRVQGYCDRNELKLTGMHIDNPEFTVVYFSRKEDESILQGVFHECGLRVVSGDMTQTAYTALLDGIESESVVLVDGSLVTPERVRSFIQSCNKQFGDNEIGYWEERKSRLWFGCIRNLWSANPDIVSSPVLIGRKSTFKKAYGGIDLGKGLTGIGYSLQKIGGLKFSPLAVKGKAGEHDSVSRWTLWFRYSFLLPFRYLVGGGFFTSLLKSGHKVQRDMVFRMLMYLFMGFAFVFMPYISKDYGISGDEYVDHRHAGYVLDYFSKGDKTALNQPETVLHLYGNAVQVIAAAIIRWFNIEDYYAFRHVIGGCVGAIGIWSVGMMGLRWCGGLCGFLSVLLMFFTPRYLGHSMNNLKDIPFAVGYGLSLFYTVRLFDCFPVFRLRHMAGLVLGIGLALGTRSGGLILYPMLLMYAGFYYIRLYGIRDFYRFGKHSAALGRIVMAVLPVVACSYVISILLWPFALQKPFSNVLYSLEKFTNFSVGLKTIFDGEQMMSNMLPWRYAPKYLCIGMPVITVCGFFAYPLYALFRKREFSLIGFFLLFAAVFPVFWVICQHSNLYGGIRHLLFVMLPMVVVAGRFWSGIMQSGRDCFKLVAVLVFAGLLALPVSHTIRNHPNDYVYFNEFMGGIRGAYGDYETDYYFNSVKRSSDWFRQHILPSLPAGRKITVVTQAYEPVRYYFRNDTNVRVIYSRYYEKYSKDWDYAIFCNVYINRFQLKHGLFPPVGVLYAPMVDGYPMSCVLERETRQELGGFRLEKEGKYQEAIGVFRSCLKEYPQNEEVWSRLGKLYFVTGQYQNAVTALEQALRLQPALNEALYMVSMAKMELKDFAGADQAIGCMLAENKFSPDALYLRADLHYRTKKYREAISDLNLLLSNRPNYEKALVLAGDIFRDNGDYRQAVKMYNQALKYRNTINVQVRVADMQVRMKNYNMAGMILDKVGQVQESYYPAYKVMVRMYLQQGKSDEARKLLKRLEDVADDVELYVLRAMYAEAVQDNTAAREALRQALEVDSGNMEALRLQREMEHREEQR